MGRSNSFGVCVITASLEAVAPGSLQSISSPFEQVGGEQSDKCTHQFGRD